MKHIQGALINGQIVGGYTFDASLQTITFTGPTIKWIDILMIINLTTNQRIYQVNCDGFGGEFDEGTQTLTLNYDTTLMSDTDELQIHINTDTKLNLQETQEAIEVLLRDIKDNTADLDINTDEIEVKLEDIKSKLDTLNGKDFATETTLDGFKTAFDSRDIASKAKQDEQTAELQSINARQSIFDSYQIADEDAVASPAYYGLTQADGTWLVLRITGTTTKSYRYANVSNNPSQTTFPDAWTNKATLSYDYWYNLTGL